MLLTIPGLLAKADDVILKLSVSEAADIRKTDSQDASRDVNEDPFEEIGHGDPSAPVRVEAWRTTYASFYDNNLQGEWYSNDIGDFAFGWKYSGSNLGWQFEEFDPEDIDSGLYDSTGLKPTLRDENNNYLFIGNHTRFHIATNYRPYVNFEAPEYLVNGNSRIKVKQLQIGWLSDRYAIIPGGESKTLDCVLCQCSPGNYSTNQFAIFAIIEIPEEWWEFENGEYIGTAILTLKSP